MIASRLVLSLRSWGSKKSSFSYSYKDNLLWSSSQNTNLKKSNFFLSSLMFLWNSFSDRELKWCSILRISRSALFSRISICVLNFSLISLNTFSYSSLISLAEGSSLNLGSLSADLRKMIFSNSMSFLGLWFSCGPHSRKQSPQANRVYAVHSGSTQNQFGRS